MALANDSVTVTPGAGATIATQLASGKEHQVVCLADQSGNLDPTIPTKPGAPATTEVIAGSATLTDSTTQTTIITVAAGKTWVGCVSLGGTWTSGTAGSTVTTCDIKTAGTNVTPSVGTSVARMVVWRNVLSTPSPVHICNVAVIAPVGNSVTLDLDNDSGTTFTSYATAVGKYVAG